MKPFLAVKWWQLFRWSRRCLSSHSEDVLSRNTVLQSNGSKIHGTIFPLTLQPSDSCIQSAGHGISNFSPSRVLWPARCAETNPTCCKLALAPMPNFCDYLLLGNIAGTSKWRSCCCTNETYKVQPHACEITSQTWRVLILIHPWNGQNKSCASCNTLFCKRKYQNRDRRGRAASSHSRQLPKERYSGQTCSGRCRQSEVEHSVVPTLVQMQPLIHLCLESSPHPPQQQAKTDANNGELKVKLRNKRYRGE